MNKSALLVLLSALLLAACSKPPAAEEPVRAVKVLTVGLDSFTAGYEFAGEVKAQVESRLGFRVGGKIIQRQAELGQRVKAGQLLAQLDPRDYQLAVAAASAQLAAAATQRDLAQADYGRYKELKAQNFISGAELERRDSTLKAAQAQFTQAQSHLALQGNQANDARLLADVAGVVTAVEAEVGQVVASGTTVLRIAADGPRDVLFSVPEDKVAAIRVGSAVTVRIWAQDGELAGRVREVGASADPVTRTYPVKVALETKQPPALGATAFVQPQGLSATGLQVIKLPTSALRQDGKSSAVWVLEPATMTLRSQIVQIATADGNQVVIAAGLQPGMLVVSAGVHVLSPGQKVTIYQQKVAAATTSPAQTAINSIATVPLSVLPASTAK